MRKTFGFLNGALIYLFFGVQVIVGCASMSTDRSGFSALDHYSFGVNWLESNEMERAERSFQKAIELDKQLGDAYIRLGMVYYIFYEREARFQMNPANISKYYTLAYNCLSNGIKYSPKNPLAYTSFARIQIIGRQFEPAVQNLLKAQELTKPEDLDIDVIIHYDLANCYLSMGKYKAALSEYESYLQLVPIGPDHDSVQMIIKEIESHPDFDVTK